MSDSTPPPDDQTGQQPGWGSVPPPSGHQPPPNWGSAYPPPGNGYPPPPGYGYPPPPGYAYPPRQKHPQATTSLVLGLVSTVGGMCCYLPVLLAPFAWFTASRTIREIDAHHGMQDGRGEAVAGRVLGIIGTVMLALGLAGLILFTVLSLTVDGFWDDFWREFWDEDDGHYESIVRSVAHLAGRT